MQKQTKKNHLIKLNHTKSRKKNVTTKLTDK